MISFKNYSSKQLILFGLIFLSGCYSFNTTIINGVKTDDIGDTVLSSDGKKVIRQNLTKTSEVSDAALCPMFVLPEILPMPELPIKQLEAIKPSNTKAIDKLERDHIIELRRYIVSTRQFIRNEHNRYLKECSEYLSKNRESVDK